MRLRAFKAVEQVPVGPPRGPAEWVAWHPSWDLQRRVKQEARWATGSPIEEQDAKEPLNSSVTDSGNDDVVSPHTSRGRPVRFERESDDWADNPIVKILYSSHKETAATALPVQEWFPGNVYDHRRDRPTFWSKGDNDDAVATDILPDWLEAGDGCAERPFDAVWTFS